MKFCYELDRTGCTKIKPKTYTVFCRIHAPAGTPKNPEGSEYSGLNQTMSGGCGDSRICSFVFNEGKSSIHVVSPPGRDSSS